MRLRAHCHCRCRRLRNAPLHPRRWHLLCISGHQWLQLRYFAQCRCAEDHEVAPVVNVLEFDSRLTAYWDAGGCGPLGNDHNWGWCGASNFDCASTVPVGADICASQVATLHSTQGDDTCCSSVVLDGCNFAYFAQYICEVAPAPAYVRLAYGAAGCEAGKVITTQEECTEA